MKMTPGSLIPQEEIEAALDELLRLATSSGERAAKFPKRVTLRSPLKPDISGQIRDELGASLEDEILPAIEKVEGGIDRREISRELVKKALVGLKLSQLRELARKNNIPSSGILEEVVTRVARAYEWDSEAIARVILENEEEPHPERGFVSRLFPVREQVDLDAAFDRLKFLSGRYIRTGIARWFTFDGVEDLRRHGPEIDEIKVTGTYRTYQASVQNDFGEVSVQSFPDETKVTIYLFDEQFINVLTTGVQAARAAANAIQAGLNVERLDYVPRADVGASGVVGNVHPVSEFMLDLLENRLKTADFTRRNLTIAKFKLDEARSEVEESTTEDAYLKPALTAVRFDGSHLLDSVAACRLLVQDRRPLVDVALRASFPYGSSTTTFPLKIAIESDHLLVATGYGQAPDVAHTAHAALVAAVIAEVKYGIEDEDQLKKLITKIAERATATEVPDVATMLVDDPST